MKIGYDAWRHLETSYQPRNMWKVVFIGAVSLVLALALGILGALFYHLNAPWASGMVAAVDAGIVFGGLKTVLDTTKAANELRKMNLDIRKLQMEIEEKTQVAEKAGAQVVVATLEEIKQYATPPLPRRPSSSSRTAAVITGVLMIVAVGGTVLMNSRLAPFPSHNEGPPVWEEGPRGESAPAEGPPASLGIPPQSPEEEIRAVLEAQVAAWNRGDVAGFMRGYWKSPETEFVSSDGVLRGWENVLARYHKAYPNRSSMGHLEFSGLEVTRLGPEAALVVGKWRLQRASGQPGGVFTLVFKKFPEGWRIINDHTSQSPNPPKP